MAELEEISPMFPIPDSPSSLFDPQTYGLVATPPLESSCNYQTSSDSTDGWTELDNNTGLVLDDCLPIATVNQHEYIVPTTVPSSSSGSIYIPESFSDQHETKPSHNLCVTESANQEHEHQTYPLPCQLDTNVTNKLKSVLIFRQKQQQQLSRDELCSCSSVKHEYSHCSDINNSSQCGHSCESTCCSSGKHENTSFNSVLKFPPCFVCGGTASGLHYGVNTCEPCKGFFVRYLRKQEEYKCEKNGTCPVTNRLRGNCSACRLKKCLALGMSRKRSRLGRYSLSRRMETIMQVNKLEKNNIDWREVQQHPVFNTSTIQQNDDTKQTGETTDEQAKTIESATKETPSQFKVITKMAASCLSQELVTVLVNYMYKIHPYGEELITQEQINDKLKSHYETYKLKIGLFGNLKTIPKDEYFNLLKGYGIEIDKRMVFLKQSANEMMNVIERYCNFAKQIPNFTNLSSRDQSNLLKSSRYDFFMILMHNGYMHEEQVFLAHNGIAFHREEVADKFFSRKLVISVCDMYHRLQRLKLTPEENALLIAISLVFTDRCSLENPQAVDQIQLSLTLILQTQLQRTCKHSASLRFTKIIDCLTMMRNSSELYLKEYNQLCQDEMVIEEVPIMTEMLFEDK